MEAVLSDRAVQGEQDAYGQRYSIDAPMTGGGREAQVRSLWIVRATEDFPRFTSCYVV